MQNDCAEKIVNAYRLNTAIIHAALSWLYFQTAQHCLITTTGKPMPLADCADFFVTNPPLMTLSILLTSADKKSIDCNDKKPSAYKELPSYSHLSKIPMLSLSRSDYIFASL